MQYLPEIIALLSGICWTVVYLDCIYTGIKYKTYAMPFAALALNIAWEGVHAIYGYQTKGLSVQIIINILWLILDAGILFTYFLYNKKYSPKGVSIHSIYGYSILGLILSVLIQIMFVKEFGLVAGGAYSAFTQNLLMSILFINMFYTRMNREGQNLNIAINKWIGTLAPTILFGILGADGFGPSSLILALGISCSVFDIIYIRLLLK